MLTPTRVLWFTLAFGLGCAPVDDPRPAAQHTTTRLGAPSPDAGAVVEGGEGVATPCAEGEDCDEVNPSLVGAPDRCAVASTECPCAADTSAVACDVDTDGPVTPRTCYTGQRDCEAGRWGRCRAYRNRFQ